MAEDELRDGLGAADVRFATMRRPGSPFATLDRRVKVIAPPALEELTRRGDPAVLDLLVDLLRDESTAWAGAVALAAVTGRGTKQVEAFAAEPEQWWQAAGRDAHAGWKAWLDEHRGRLRWDPDEAAFVAGDR